MSSKPLEGIKVIDLSYYIAGPGTSRILAEWGAEVIKVEPIGGEPGRTTGVTLGLPAKPDNNPYFGLFNYNKRDIALDLKKSEGLAIMDKLLAGANVFVTSFRPGALTRLGLEYESVHAKYPHIVWASINGFGDYGPDKDKAGFDVVAFWARSGAMMDLVEKENASPVNPTLGFGDTVTACSLSGGISAALYRQAKTGEGSKVMVSLLSQAIWNLGPVVASAQVGDTYPKSRKAPSTPLVNSYQTSDGKWLFVGVFDDRMYPVFLEKVLLRKDLAENPRYFIPAGAKACTQELTSIIAEEFSKHTQEEMLRRLVAADIAHEKINHAADMLTDCQAVANNYVISVTHGSGEQSLCSMPPVKFDTIEPKEEYRTPLVGEHTLDILRELGCSDEEITQLMENKVAAQA